MKFKATEVKDSLLMYGAKSSDGKGDFASLAIKDGHLEFRFDTGSGNFVHRLDEASPIPQGGVIPQMPGKYATPNICQTAWWGRKLYFNRCP